MQYVKVPVMDLLADAFAWGSYRSRTGMKSRRADGTEITQCPKCKHDCHEPGNPLNWKEFMQESDYLDRLSGLMNYVFTIGGKPFHFGVYIPTKGEYYRPRLVYACAACGFEWDEYLEI